MGVSEVTYVRNAVDIVYGRNYDGLMMNNTKQMWRFQHECGNEVSVHDGYATDARGLRLRQKSGYTHVKMTGTPDDGWLQIGVAIRKLESREWVAARTDAA